MVGAGHSKSNSQIQPFFSSPNFTTIYFPSAPGSEEAGVRMDRIHLNACCAQTSTWPSRLSEWKCKMNTQRRNEYLMMIINCLDCCSYTIRRQCCSYERVATSHPNITINSFNCLNDSVINSECLSANVSVFLESTDCWMFFSIPQ